MGTNGTHTEIARDKAGNQLAIGKRVVVFDPSRDGIVDPGEMGYIHRINFDGVGSYGPPAVDVRSNRPEDDPHDAVWMAWFDAKHVAVVTDEAGREAAQ